MKALPLRALKYHLIAFTFACRLLIVQGLRTAMGQLVLIRDCVVHVMWVVGITMTEKLSVDTASFTVSMMPICSSSA
jgi:hypothetical protein